MIEEDKEGFRKANLKKIGHWLNWSLSPRCAIYTCSSSCLVYNIYMYATELFIEVPLKQCVQN